MLTSTKLSVNLRLRLYVAIVVSTMTYGSEAWLFTDEIKRNVNHTNSKMLAAITNRTIHDEAKAPSYDVVSNILKRRRSYLGHVLRMDDNRTVKRYLLELSPDQAPFVAGSLLNDTDYRTKAEIIQHAVKRTF